MKNNKSKNILIAILISFIILLLVMIFLIYNGTFKLENGSNNERTSNNSDVKINDNLEYIYDATYSYNNIYTEFSRPFLESENVSKKITNFGIEVEYTEGVQYLKNLKVPYININSYDAGQANKELEQLYIDAAKTFDSCAEDKSVGCSQILTYRTYIYDNILSVVTIDSVQATSPWVLNYKTYNFDLNTGKKLSYAEVLFKLNYKQSETTIKIEELLKEKMNTEYGNYVGDLSDACIGQNYVDKVNCYEKANELLKKSIENNEILYFVDNSGDLNVLPIAYYNVVQNGELNRFLIKVPNNKKTS